MKAAGLKAIDTVVESTAVLIKSKHPSNQKLVNMIASRIKGVISKPTSLYATSFTLLTTCKLPSDLSSVSTTSNASCWRKLLKSPRANERLPLQPWKMKHGLQ